MFIFLCVDGVRFDGVDDAGKEQRKAEGWKKEKIMKGKVSRVEVWWQRLKWVNANASSFYSLSHYPYIFLRLCIVPWASLYVWSLYVCPFGPMWTLEFPCIQVWAYVFKYERMYSSMSACIQVWAYVFKYECMYSSMSVCIQVWAYVFKYERMFSSMSACF